jgi:hypothetical protein
MLLSLHLLHLPNLRIRLERINSIYEEFCPKIYAEIHFERPKSRRKCVVTTTNQEDVDSVINVTMPMEKIN